LTGGGSSSAVLLNPLEERGISVWGCFTVTGTPSVCISGGFQAEAHNELLSGGEEENEDLGQVEDDEVMQQPSDRPTPQKPKGRILKKSAKGIGEFLELHKKNIDPIKKKTTFLAIIDQFLLAVLLLLHRPHLRLTQKLGNIRLTENGVQLNIKTNSTANLLGIPTTTVYLKVVLYM
jgi:hypothetical protein